MGTPDEETGQRITRLWQALGYPTSKAFAKALKVSAQRLNNVENGLPLSRDLANKIVQATSGMTTDWLWYGSTDGLSVAMDRLLREFDTRTG